MTLAELLPGQRATIVSHQAETHILQRLYEFGLLEGEPVELIAFAPLGDPIEIRIGHTRLSLRKHEAESITVALIEESR